MVTDRTQAHQSWSSARDEEAREDAKKAEIEARIEMELQPVKDREQHAWLAAHPDKTSEDFDRAAWPHLRANLVADRQRLLVEMAMERMRRSGRYEM